MAELISAAEVQFIKNHLQVSHLEISIRPSWGSKQASHREEIHGELKKKMAKAYPFSDSSISHCLTLGGFVFTQFDSDHVIQIGFDLEEDSRVTTEVARRVCLTEDEFQRAPSAASLWSAKEAAFKSLKGPKQPLVVSEIELTDWKKLDSQYETVNVAGSAKFQSSQIQGILLKKNPYTFAFFIARP
ncbi:MAG: 4'-phosphopantetheinyl transferase superfamily protein [Pseudobdellovibrionaceae bacterium]